MLAGDFKLAALQRNLVEEAGVLERDSRLIGETLHQADDGGGKGTGAAALQDKRAEGAFAR